MEVSAGKRKGYNEIRIASNWKIRTLHVHLILSDTVWQFREKLIQIIDYF